MASAVQTRPAPAPPKVGTAVTHIEMCCYEDEALCGEDLSGLGAGGTDNHCHVCEDLNGANLTCDQIRRMGRTAG